MKCETAAMDSEHGTAVRILPGFEPHTAKRMHLKSITVVQGEKSCIVLKHHLNTTQNRNHYMLVSGDAAFH